VDAEGSAIREVFVGEDQHLDARADADADRLYGARCLLGTSRMAVRKAALARLLPFGRTVLFEADEYVFNLLPALGKVCILSARLTDYRLHGANNYQSARPSLEKTRRFREVHEELLASMLAARARLGLSGRYVERCEDGLRTLCRRLSALESALQSRPKAAELIWRDPRALGLVNAPWPKRALYASMALVFGLPFSLASYSRLRAWLRPGGGAADARLL